MPDENLTRREVANELGKGDGVTWALDSLLCHAGNMA